MTLDIDLLLEDKVFMYDMNEIIERTGNSNDIHFIVIGAGGTGGYLIPNLGRMVGIKNKEGAEHTVTIVDADHVEEKNLLRQNFSPNDIGKNKAEVMATRYGRAFGETFYYLSEYIESAEQVKQLIEQEKKTTVIIDCVDNNKTRFIVKEGVRQYHEEKGSSANSTATVSSGNEEYAGQIVFSYKIGKYAEFYRENLNLRSESPDLIDIFPDMNIGLLPDEESCAERAVSAPQNIATNMTAADIIFGYVNKLLNNVPIDTLMYFFDSRTMIRKAYSGRETHVKELLRLVEGNENLSRFVPGEKWTGVDKVKAPTYEEVLSSSAEVDTILENAEELEENSPNEQEEVVLFSIQDEPEIAIQEQIIDEEAMSNLLFDDEVIIENIPSIVDYEINQEDSFIRVTTSQGVHRHLTTAGENILITETPESGFPSSILVEDSSEEQIDNLANEPHELLFSVEDMPEISIVEYYEDGEPLSDLIFNDTTILRGVLNGIDYYENYEHLTVEVVIREEVDRYLTTEGSSYFVGSRVLNENTTIIDEEESISFTFMNRQFSADSLSQQINNNLLIYNDNTRNIDVRNVASNNLTRIINELVSLEIIESETIDEFEYFWSNHHTIIINSIIESNTTERDREEPSFTFMGTPFNSESFGEQIDDNLSIYNDDTRDLGVRDVAADNLTSIIDELISLGIIDIETIEEFEDLWTNHHETVIDEIIDSHVNRTEEFESQQIPLQFEFEDEDTVNFNLEEPGEVNSSDSSFLYDEETEQDYLISYSHNVLGQNEVVLPPGEYPCLLIIDKLKQRKFALEMYASADLNFLDFHLSTTVLSYVESTIEELEDMYESNNELFCTIHSTGLMNEGITVLPAGQETSWRESPLISEEYILSHYQNEIYVEKPLDEVLNEAKEQYINIVIATINNLIPQSQVTRVNEVKNYITNLILTISNYRGNESLIKINNHGAWIGIEKIMDIEINDIYRIRNNYSNVDVRIINQPSLDASLREFMSQTILHSLTNNTNLTNEEVIQSNDLSPGIYDIDVIVFKLRKLLEQDLLNNNFNEISVNEIESRQRQINQLAEILTNNEFKYIRLPHMLSSIIRNNSSGLLDYNLIRNLTPDEMSEYISVDLS